MRLALCIVSALVCAGRAQADLSPDWIAKLPVGTSLAAGIAGTTGDAGGVTYVTGTTGGPTGYTDVVTAAFAPDGALLWSRTFDGPVHWNDQGHAIALGPGGVVWVAGNTPGPEFFAQVLLLAYDATSGAQLQAIQWSSGPGTSEYGGSIVVDAKGDVYIGGGTVGDGGDALILKFDASGQMLWKWVWDGPAWSPYSGDSVQQLAFSPAGELTALIEGGMSSLKPDYVVAKLNPDAGALIFLVNWGLNDWESPREMEFDASGDIYITGTSITTDRYYTIKVRGTTGALLWQAYDSGGVHNTVRALALDSAGGVYVTGIADPDMDVSNSNDNYYTVKRNGATGALLWTHHYGLNCVGCFDGPSDVAVDPEGHVFVAGSSSSAPYSGDALTLVLSASTGFELDRGALSGSPTEYVYSGFLRFNAAFDLLNAGEMYNVNTGARDISIFKYASLLDGSGPTIYCTAKTSSAGCIATISTSNVDAQPTSGANDYYVTAWMVQEQKLGLLFGGVSGAASLPFNGGTLCANAPLTRGPAIPSGGSAPNACGGVFSTLVNDGHLFPLGLDAGPGQSAWYQYWFRDPSNGPGSFGTSLSNALRLDFQ